MNMVIEAEMAGRFPSTHHRLHGFDLRISVILNIKAADNLSAYCHEQLVG